MADSLENQASRPRFSLSLAGDEPATGNGIPDNTAAVPGPAAAGGLGGMTFGQAISPGGNAKDHSVLDSVARMNEHAATIALFTQKGQEAYKRAPEALKQITAPKYAELFAVAGEAPTEEQQRKIDRLQALEAHQAKTAGLGIEFQTAPVQVLGEIAKLRGELDADTMQIRTQASRTAMAEAKLKQRQAESEISNAEVSDALDAYDTQKLQSALADGSFKKMHPDATYTDVLDKLKERKDANDPAQPDALTPDKRKAIVDARLGMLTPAQREQLMQHQQVEGPMAFTLIPENPVALTGKETPEQVAKMQADHDAIVQRNQRVTMFSNFFRGMTPTLDETVNNLADLYDKSIKLGMGPGSLAQIQKNALDMTQLEAEKVANQSKYLAQMNFRDQGDMLSSTISQLRSLSEREQVTRDPKVLADIQKQKSEIIAERNRNIDASIDKVVDNAGVAQTVKDYARTGDFGSQIDGANGLAYLGSSGDSLLGEQRAFMYKTVDANGIETAQSLPLGSAASSATTALKAVIDDAYAAVDAGSDPVKQAVAKEKSKNKDTKGPQYKDQYDVNVWSSALKSIAKTPAYRVAQDSYRATLYNQALAIGFNEVAGNDIASRAIYNQLFEVSNSGPTLKPRFMSKREGSPVPMPDLSRIADFLTENKRTDILENVRSRFEDKQFSDQIVRTLRPQSATEQATYKYLFGNNRVVVINPTDRNYIAGPDHDRTVRIEVLNDFNTKVRKEIEKAPERLSYAEQQRQMLIGQMAAPLQ